MKRRDFTRTLLASACAGGLNLIPTMAHAFANRSADSEAVSMQFGLVTYLWGKDMDLPTLLETCEKAGIGGVELRTEHAHHVEPNLTTAQRQDVRKRFADSPVKLVGYGSNAQFHENDPAKVQHNIELTKQYIQLMHDCGGTGVKVKPNGFVEGVPHEKTVEQIGLALRALGAYGEGFGQQIRVEVHGRETSELPVIKAIFDVANHPNVKVCWNSNAEDLSGQGLDHNFRLVQAWLGETVHVRELTLGDYPYEQLFRLLQASNYQGWILLEARTDPADKVAALIEQRKRFEQLNANRS